QGGIGHILALALDSRLRSRGLAQVAAAVLTHAEVAADDPAFDHPTKPLGGVMDADTAARRVVEGWQVAETSPGTWRRVVPSPRPLAVMERDAIGALVASGAVVIAAGGGGIPIVTGPDGWRPIDAVIDKDRTAAVLAAQVGASHLVIITAVEEVSVGWGTPQQRGLRQVDAATLATHLAAGEFPAGSMGPKVEACLDFLADGGKEALITSLPTVRAALNGAAGTHITPTT
ncbi:MAG TPA: carbamate kinase, partial [Arachnia sp.]|nr:carbamate kinase [Arachnia sp.]